MKYIPILTGHEVKVIKGQYEGQKGIVIASEELTHYYSEDKKKDIDNFTISLKDNHLLYTCTENEIILIDDNQEKGIESLQSLYTSHDWQKLNFIDAKHKPIILAYNEPLNIWEFTSVWDDGEWEYDTYKVSSISLDIAIDILSKFLNTGKQELPSPIITQNFTKLTSILNICQEHAISFELYNVGYQVKDGYHFSLHSIDKKDAYESTYNNLDIAIEEILTHLNSKKYQRIRMKQTILVSTDNITNKKFRKGRIYSVKTDIFKNLTSDNTICEVI